VLPGYLLSLLVRQRALLAGRFDTRYPHAWLVWEPGSRLPPQNPTELEAGKTHLPEPGTVTHPVGNDAVCFPVPEVRAGNVLTLGRQGECSITIDDMSISREHALLSLHGSFWQIELAPTASMGMFVRNASLVLGQPVTLINGCSLSAGLVRLTFYERGRFIDRLLAEEKRLSS
jgi:hypothetical protein